LPVTHKEVARTSCSPDRPTRMYTSWDAH